MKKNILHKKPLRKLAAVGLALTMTLSYAQAAAYGKLAQESYLTINEGTMLNTNIWKDGETRQTERYIEYTPGDAVKPIVAYGGKLYGRSTIDYVAKYVEDEELLSTDNKDVIAGINGDFFEFTTGVSLGAVVTKGCIRSSDNSRAAIGFNKDGTILLGEPGYKTTVTLGDMTFENVHINKELTATSGPVLYTEDYADTNKSSIPCTSVVIRMSQNYVYPGSVFYGSVMAVSQTDGEAQIPQNCMILSVATNSAYSSDSTVEKFKTLALNDSASISITANAGWTNVEFAVGSGSWLVKDGQAQEQTDSTAKELTARTAVGKKEDGTIVFYTIDGEQSGYSTGVTLETLAARMVELGCTHALCLDGGGSTSMSASYPGYGNLESISKPTDGALRKCANFIYLINTKAPTGETAKLFLYPYTSWLLAGATQKYEVKSADENWYETEAPIVTSFDGGELGKMDDYGVFTAEKAGQSEVYVTSMGITGKAVVNVIETPDSISVKKENGSEISGSLVAAPAAEIDLTASAKYNDMTLTSTDSCYKWETTGGVGTIDGNGLFKAAYTDSAITGNIIVSRGEVKTTIAVTVTPQLASGKAVEGFETDASVPQSEDKALTASLESDLTLVKYGHKSLKLAYDFTLAGTETPPSAKLSVALTDEPTHLAFWLRGDGQGNSLNVITATADGTPDVHTVAIDFTGWKYITVSLAEGTTQVKGIGMTAGSTGDKTGSVYLDQMIQSTGALSDLTPPTITGGVEGGIFTGSVIDAGLTPVTKSGIAVTIDGAATDFQFGDNGVLTASLPTGDEKTHRLRIVAADACGNLSSQTYSIPGAEESPFTDMSGHWADSVTTYLYGQGVVSGIKDENGNLTYQPDTEMTREQFAVIMTNWLGTDLTKYSAVELPFDDNEDISWWALDAVKAVYSLGIIKGDSSGGTLNFKPLASLTRSEAMTIIGRTQPRGYTEAALDSFADYDAVPDWAEVYIKTLISQGVVSGSNGSILPNDSVTRSQVAKMLCVLV